jgi:penicillin amidase
LPEGFNSYEELLDAAIVNSLSRLKQLTKIKADSDDMPKYAQLNQAKIRHPLSQAVPVLGGWLNMPEQALAGDSHMPRVQHSSFGQSQRMVVAPGHEQLGMLTIPAGQSGHPLSPFYRADHAYWLNEVPLPFLPGPKKYQLRLVPAP